VPVALIDGIPTRYETVGDGPPLLMYSPGGFDSRLENWSDLGVYRTTGLLGTLSSAYTCVMFDRRESGRSGGRVERITWASYVAQGAGLLDHLGIDTALAIGGCVGCSSVLALAVAHPERIRGMVLYSPAGGPRYRMTQHARFEQHASFVRQAGMAAVVDLATSHDRTFTQDPRVGPWVSVIRTDAAFATAYAKRDAEDYLLAVTATARTLYDRDTVPGAEPEDLMRLAIPALIVPGQDTSHAPSAARYLQECLPGNDYWDAPVAEPTAGTARERVLGFLAALK
jgi:pimeloyl-ACP methyl ester carboxylesterase